MEKGDRRPLYLHILETNSNDISSLFCCILRHPRVCHMCAVLCASKHGKNQLVDWVDNGLGESTMAMIKEYSKDYLLWILK